MASDDDRAVFTAKAAYQPANTRAHLQPRDDLSMKNGNAAGLGRLDHSPQPSRRTVLSFFPRLQPLFLDLPQQSSEPLYPLQRLYFSVGSPDQGKQRNKTPEKMQPGVNDTFCVFTPHPEVS